METIHTDSAYKIVSRKDFSRAETELHRPSHHRERTLNNSDNPDHVTKPSSRDEHGALTSLWRSFHNKIEQIEDADAFVNYGLVIMLPLLGISMWLSG